MNNYQPRNAGYTPATIKSILRRKCNAVADTIKDEELQHLFKRDAIITGGCIASMLLGERVNDYDLYFSTADTCERVARYYVERFKASHPTAIVDVERVDGRVKINLHKAGALGLVPADASDADAEVLIETETELETNHPNNVGATPRDTKTEVENFEPVFITENAISLKGGVQLVMRFSGAPDEIHRNFDFVHCTSYWMSDEGALVLRPEALQALLSRTLYYVGSLYPVATLVRIRKFVRRGWKISAGQILKIAMQLSDLDMKNINVLREQLTGVDSAYFNTLIRAVEKDAAEGAEINTTYIVELIDRILT